MEQQTTDALTILARIGEHGGQASAEIGPDSTTLTVRHGQVVVAGRGSTLPHACADAFKQLQRAAALVAGANPPVFAEAPAPAPFALTIEISPREFTDLMQGATLTREVDGGTIRLVKGEARRP